MSLDAWVADPSNAQELVWNTQNPLWDDLWWTLSILASNNDFVAFQGVIQSDQGVHMLAWAPPQREEH